MPFAPDEIRYDLACGPGADGCWRGWFTVYVAADALRGLGLHPAQATSTRDGFSPPAWWHAAGERYGRRWPVRPAPE
ncbi:hypothetical protein PV331_08305 [Streptomyces sp. WI04-05B]|nr:hypothetical protein [Streptomyces sp. WI04-05B]MDX2586946.1 hypothetical protein [Streptomyces sp. WI04-05A]MDX3749914.1 hypothetical protein [Streptomyces sp. AK08-02]